MNIAKYAALSLASALIITVFSACSGSAEDVHSPGEVPEPEAQSQQIPEPVPSSKPRQEPAPEVEPEQYVKPQPAQEEAVKPEPQSEKKPQPETKPESKPQPEKTPESNPTPQPSEASETALEIAALAESLIGTEFEYGASGPDTFDNSGFVYYVCKENGVSIPRRSSEIAAAGDEISRSELLPGDIAVFANEVGGSAGFVGIYVGDDQFIACNNEKTPTKLQSMAGKYWDERFLFGRRVA